MKFTELVHNKGNFVNEEELIVINGSLAIPGGKQIARYELFYLNLHSHPPDYPFFDLFDVSGELEVYYAPLFMEPNPDLEDAFQKNSELTVEEAIESGLYDPLDNSFPKERFANGVVDIVEVHLADILILHQLEILPEYRGKRLGLWLTGEIIQSYTKPSDMAILQATPRTFFEDDEWHRQMRYDLFGYRATPVIAETQKLINAEKLIKHWQQLGFRRIDPYSDFMVRKTDRLPVINAEAL